MVPEPTENREEDRTGNDAAAYRAQDCIEFALLLFLISISTGAMISVVFLNCFLTQWKAVFKQTQCPYERIKECLKSIFITA